MSADNAQGLRQLAASWKAAAAKTLDRRQDDNFNRGARAGAEQMAACAERLETFLATHPPQQERAAVPDGLWCLHVSGPDDVCPAPSKAHAEAAAILLNASAVAARARDMDVMLSASAQPWPYGAEAHAATVGDFEENWLVSKDFVDRLRAAAPAAPATPDIVDAVDDPNGVCPTCYQRLRLDATPESAEPVAGEPYPGRWRLDDVVLNAGRLKALHRCVELARKWSRGCGVRGHTDDVVRKMADELYEATRSQDGDYTHPTPAASDEGLTP